MGNEIQPAQKKVVDSNGMFFFDKDSSKWVPQKRKTSIDVDLVIPAITLMTYNVWFDYYRQKERFELFLKEVEAHSPDIICLQEGTFVKCLLFLSHCSIAKFFEQLFSLAFNTKKLFDMLY